MADGAHVEAIESLQEFTIYLSRFREELASICDTISIEYQRVDRWFNEEGKGYWISEYRRAEQRFNEARDALWLCRAKVRADDREACSEQKKQFERAQQRLRVCEAKLKQLKHCQLAWDHFANQAKPRLGEAVDLVDTRLPSARAELSAILDVLEKYRNQ